MSTAKLPAEEHRNSGAAVANSVAPESATHSSPLESSNVADGVSGGAGKLWRLLFAVLVGAIGGVLGFFGANAALSMDLPGIGDKSGFIPPLWRTVFPIAGAIFGFALGSLIFRRVESLGDRLREMTTRDRLALITGLIIGLILTAALSIPLLLSVPSKLLGLSLTLLVGILITYLSTAAAFSLKEEVRFYLPPAAEEEEVPQESFKILDTNVIIDGRIADIARAGFIDGVVYIPGFVLDELQHIADSSDSLKRARGRRGLDILNAMRNEMELVVRSYDRLVPGNDEVDARLVRLAKALNSAIVTNDFNLNKVAELQGVPVLNINELANALKPVVLPGEAMRVLVVKEGKEVGQGVGYLDDGTMIVVEGGRRYQGETVSVLVSSVLQTQAGKMIFAELQEGDGGQEDTDNIERGVRAYTSRRPRRPVR